MAQVSQDIFKSILDQIEGFSPKIESVEVGRVLEVGDGIARVSGLENIQMSEASKIFR